MKIRIITAVIALAVFAGVLLAPPIVFTVALAAVILFMIYECYCATKADMPMKAVGMFSAVLMMGTVVFTWKINNKSPAFLVFLIAAIALSLLMYMTLTVARHGKRDYKEILSNAFLTIYIVLSMGSVWLAKEMYGTVVMLLIFICAWSTDTFAYFTGRIFGKHKLIPRVSPNKTVEGSIGGIIGSVIVCIIYIYITNRFLPLKNDSLINIRDGHTQYILFALFGAVGGVLSQIGDLAASAIKRDSDIKDFGWVFPGHGGFMDRFDSVMYIAPVLHILIMIILMI